MGSLVEWLDSSWFGRFVGELLAIQVDLSILGNDSSG